MASIGGAAPERKVPTILDEILMFLNTTFSKQALAQLVLDIGKAIHDALPNVPRVLTDKGPLGDLGLLR